jgi:type 1 glutamine amidotransferase
MRQRVLFFLLALPVAMLSGQANPGHGKTVVLIAGDDEYHSEQMMPQFAEILEKRQGFRCTVLFSKNAQTGQIDPHARGNIPGLAALKKADLLILFTRFRDLPDEQMKYFVDYVASGKPIFGIRTATHAFEIASGKTYARYSWNSKEAGWEGGFGRRVLGETWIAHHGDHGKQSTRGRIVPEQRANPILRGIADGEIWVPTDVYEVRLPLPEGCVPLVRGEVLTGMKATDGAVQGKANEPMLPVAWTTTYKGARVFTTTMGSAEDFSNEALRRLFVNAALWAVGRDGQIPEKSDVELVGDYHPTSFLLSY